MISTDKKKSQIPEVGWFVGLCHKEERIVVREKIEFSCVLDVLSFYGGKKKRRGDLVVLFQLSTRAECLKGYPVWCAHNERDWDFESGKKKSKKK